MTKSTIVSATPTVSFIDVASSGATIKDTFVVDASPLVPSATVPLKRFSYLKAAAFATILPFVSLEEVMQPRRRYAAETASEYVVTIRYEDGEFWIDSPTIIAINVKRPTLRFSSDQPLRMLPPRAPFISPAALIREDE